MDPIRLLLVEDSDDDAALIAGRLRRGGLTVVYERVEAPAEMEAVLRSRPPDMVISDCKMPSFDAEEALELLHRSGLDVPFIVVSGQIGEETAAGLMRAGAQDFVLKDNLTRLAPAVQRELREATDRHERRQAQAALRTSEDKFRLLAEHISDAVFRHRLRPEPQLEYLSPMAASMFGRDPDGLDDAEQLFAAVHPEDRPAMVQAWRTPPTRPLVVRCPRPDGTTAWIEQRAVPVRDEQGDVVAVEGILRDITDQVLARETREELERRLHQADRLDALGQLAGGIAHDFNNILGVITGYTRLVLGSLPEDHPSRDDLRLVDEAAVQAAGLAKQLLIFSSRQPSQPQTVDLNAEAAAAERLLRRTIGEDIEFVTRLEPDLDHVTIDPSRLEQIILNLVVNARAAMPSGGRLLIETATAPESGSWRTPDLPAGRYVRLTVRDTGCGMDPEVARRAFEPFFTTKGPGKGTGLGLATVYGATKEAGGTVTLRSEPDRGTEISIYLPAAEPVTVAVAATPQPGNGQGERILVVEDNDPLRTIVERMLSGAGYQVVTAATRDEALVVIENAEEQLHVVLSDIVMPGLPVGEFIEQVRRARPDVRILLMSGYSAPETLTGPALEALRIIAKPFDTETLLDAVQHSLLAPDGPGPRRLDDTAPGVTVADRRTP